MQPQTLSPEPEYEQPDLATLLDQVPSMIGYWDNNLICRIANRAHSRFFEIDPALLPGMHMRALLGNEMFDGNLRYVEAALSGTPVSFERTFPSRGRSKAHYTVAHFMPDIAGGVVRGFYCLEHDVTEVTESKHQLAALIRDSEGLLRTLHQQALLSVADSHGRLTDANEGFCTISGYGRRELLGRNHSMLSSGAHSREFWQALWHTLNAGNPWRGEICNRAKNGSLYWVDSIIAPCFNENGRIVKFISIRFDITDHKIAQQRLQESEAFLERAEKVSGVGGFMIDLASGTQKWTRQAYRIHDIEDGRSPAAELTDAFLTAIRVEVQEALHSASEGAAGYNIEIPLVTAKGRPIWIRTTGEVERLDGVPTRIVGAMQDITERRLMEQKLRDATALAEKANQSKSQFLANMSHEIRTPLNAVIGLGYLLELTGLGDDQRQLLAKIQFAGHSLLGVVNNVLDLSKVEAGEMSLENETLNLAELVRDVGQMLAPQATGKGIEFKVECAADLPSAVNGDSLRLRQILINLVSNSIKFTEAGSVLLKASCLERDSAGVRLRCEVSDSGVGIEPKALQRLFTPFTQADASTTRRFGGTGLGLSIARRFVELMDGDIGVSSTVGVGSTFWIEIPLRIDPVGEGRKGAAKRQDLRVWIADAHGDGPGGLGVLVRALGWIALVVTTGEQLISEMKRTPANAWPDVLIVEQNLLDIDAQQLMTRLKKECTHNALPPIIVVTDLAQFSDNAPLVQPTDALLVRPVTGGALFNAVNSLVWTRYGGHEQELKAAPFNDQETQWLAGVRVLVADDSDINREVARRILEKQGAIVTTCGDGQAALENVRLHHRQLDIVLMDVQMPLLDGNEATRRIRGELELPALPIVALTAGALVSERRRALESGMTDFITKPFAPLDLVGKVRRLVEQARGSPISMVFIDRLPIAQPIVGALPPSIDAAAVRRIFGDDEPLFRSLLAGMLREYSDIALLVRLPLDDPANRTHLDSRLHKLLGSAGLIGARDIVRLTGDAEEALREERSPGVVTGILEQLAAALTTLRQEAADAPQGPPRAVQNGASIVSGPSASGADIDELCALLENQNLAAVDKFTVLADSLSERLGGPRFDLLRDAIDNLDFQRGAEVLRRISPIQLRPSTP